MKHIHNLRKRIVVNAFTALVLFVVIMFAWLAFIITALIGLYNIGGWLTVIAVSVASFSLEVKNNGITKTYAIIKNDFIRGVFFWISSIVGFVAFFVV